MARPLNWRKPTHREFLINPSGVNVSISMKLDMSIFDYISPQQTQAFMRGIAEVISAGNPQQIPEKGDRA